MKKSRVKEFLMMIVLDAIFALGIIDICVAAGHQSSWPTPLLIATIFSIIGAIITAVALCYPVEQGHAVFPLAIILIGIGAMAVGCLATRTLGIGVIWVATFALVLRTYKRKVDKRRAAQFRALIRERLRQSR